MLDRVTAVWTLDDAESWWSRHERGQSRPARRRLGRKRRNRCRPINRSNGRQQRLRIEFRLSAGTGTVPPGFDRTAVFEPPDDLQS